MFLSFCFEYQSVAGTSGDFSMLVGSLDRVVLREICPRSLLFSQMKLRLHAYELASYIQTNPSKTFILVPCSTSCLSTFYDYLRYFNTTTSVLVPPSLHAYLYILLRPMRCVNFTSPYLLTLVLRFRHNRGRGSCQEQVYVCKDGYAPHE
jgi:hypothetical protein